jgi:hypothetical protein
MRFTHGFMHGPYGKDDSAVSPAMVPSIATFRDHAGNKTGHDSQHKRCKRG